MKDAINKKKFFPTAFVYLETILRVLPGGNALLNRLIPEWENRGVLLSEMDAAACHGAARLENQLRATLEPRREGVKKSFWAVMSKCEEASKVVMLDVS